MTTKSGYAGFNTGTIRGSIVFIIAVFDPNDVLFGRVLPCVIGDSAKTIQSVLRSVVQRDANLRFDAIAFGSEFPAVVARLRQC